MLFVDYILKLKNKNKKPREQSDLEVVLSQV